ncbi:hypothetical protein [Kribbella hippodromi]
MDAEADHGDGKLGTPTGFPCKHFSICLPYDAEYRGVFTVVFGDARLAG